MLFSRKVYNVFLAIKNLLNRRRLKVHEFSIITNSCIGAVIYHKLGVKYQSPFINCGFSDADFVKLVRNLKVYMEQKLCFVEIAEKVDSSLEYFVIEPFATFRNTLPQITSIDVLEREELIDKVNNEVKPQRVITGHINCFKPNKLFKHQRLATFTAMSCIFHNYVTYYESDNLPYVIINMKCDSNAISKKDLDEIISETTAAYVNAIHEYPNIFVAFSDNTKLTSDDEEDKKDKKKKKKDKKKNKKNK